MAELSPVARALLETIAGPESAGDYNVIYGGSQFDSYADHPRQYVTITSGPNKGKKSSAAGKYQFLGSTWDDIAERYDIPDFSPANQDLAAWYLAKEEYRRDTGRDLEADLQAGDLSRVPASLRNQWTSMPGGIEQGINASAFANAYAQHLGQPVTPAVAAINAAAPQAPVMRPAAGKGNFWSALTTPIRAGLAATGVQPTVMRAASAVQGARPSNIFQVPMPIRNAVMSRMMQQNIGSAPSVAQGHGGPGTRAYAVTSGGSAPVMLAGSGNGGDSTNGTHGIDRHGQNMDVYRANAEVLGGSFTQQNINNALSQGHTLYTLA